MLTREEQNEILSLTRELLPSVLEEINFDPNDGKKEKGHRSGEDLETTFVREFIERDNIRFTEPTADRAMADFLFNSNTRLIVSYYSPLWSPLLSLASILRFK